MPVTFLTDEDEKRYVRSVNGKKPDANGNVAIETGSGGGAQPDWNAAEGEAGHILNRPFYKTAGATKILDSYQPVYDESEGTFMFAEPFSLEDGGAYTITWNGADYNCTAASVVVFDGTPAVGVGNFGAAGLPGFEDTGEPFLLLVLPSEMAAEMGVYGIGIDMTGATEVTVSISSGSVVPIPMEYLPAGYPYVIPGGEEILPEMAFVCNQTVLPIGNVSVGAPYKVVVDGTAYSSKAAMVSIEGTPLMAIGNLSMLSQGADTGEPFVIAKVYGSWMMLLYKNGESGTVSVTSENWYVPMDVRYLPEIHIREENLPESALFTKYVVKFTKSGDGNYVPDRTFSECRALATSGADLVASVNYGSTYSDELQLAYFGNNSIQFFGADVWDKVTLFLTWDGNTDTASLITEKLGGAKQFVMFTMDDTGTCSTNENFTSVLYSAGYGKDIVARIDIDENSHCELPVAAVNDANTVNNQYIDFFGMVSADEIAHLRWGGYPTTVKLTRTSLTNGGKIPEKGVDYFTEEDKAELVQEVLDQIGTGVIGEVDADNNILITSTLPNGTYTMRYENADGSTTVIGTFTVSGTVPDPEPDPAPDPEPTIVNLADPTSADWLTNKRINSGGTLKDISDAERGNQTMIMTNKIPISGVTKLHIKGLDIMSNLVASNNNFCRYYVYLDDGTLQSWQLQPSQSAVSSFVTTASYDSSVVVVDIPSLTNYIGAAYNLTHIRLGGILTGTAEDVIITADQDIV